jgi:hypothetical protein
MRRMSARMSTETAGRRVGLAELFESTDRRLKHLLVRMEQAANLKLAGSVKPMAK